MLNMKINIENKMMDSFKTQTDAFDDDAEDIKQRLKDLYAQKEENRLRVMKEKKIELSVHDKADPNSMDVAHMNFNAIT